MWVDHHTMWMTGIKGAIETKINKYRSVEAILMNQVHDSNMCMISKLCH